MTPHATHAMSPSSRPIRIVLRYDDYSSQSPTDWEEQLIGVLERCGVSCAFGVTPFACRVQLDAASQDRTPLTPRQVSLLRTAVERGTLEPMLHGATHRRAAVERLASAHPSELVGTSFEHQHKRLSAALASLECDLERPVRIFAPPWNSYDEDTVRVLEDLDFQVLSSGPRYGPAKSSGSLRYLPATTDLDSLPDAIETARGLDGGDSWIVALFHSYDFVEVDPETGTWTLDRFQELVESIAAEDDLVFTSITEAIRSRADLSAERYLLHRALRRGRRLLPTWLRPLSPRVDGTLIPRALVRRWVRRQSLLKGCYYAAIVLASAILGRTAKSPSTGTIAMGGMLVLPRVARRRRLSYKSASALAAILGFCFGRWLRR